METTTIRAIGLDEMKLVIAWAAREGWNPGVDDARAFHAADPDGFFLREVDGKPVAAVSVVNYDAHFSFLGLYICHPDYRGKGHGIAVWRAGVAHAGGRVIGLDGLAAQVGNYAKSGFASYDRSVRHRGFAERVEEGMTRAVRGEEDIEKLVRADNRAMGMSRGKFTRNWFTDTPTRRTRILSLNGEGEDIFVTFRTAEEGVKIGPLFAETEEQVDVLLGSAPLDLKGSKGPIFVDAAESCEFLVGLLKARGFSVTFAAERMYTGAPPVEKRPTAFAVLGMEVG